MWGCVRHGAVYMHCFTTRETPYDPGLALGFFMRAFCRQGLSHDYFRTMIFTAGYLSDGRLRARGCALS